MPEAPGTQVDVDAGLVEALRRARAAALEGATGLASFPHAAESPIHSGKPRAFCH